MKITFGAVLLIAIIVAAFFFFRSKTGKRVKTRATGTATEAIIKDASTPEGAKAYYNEAIDAKKDQYNKANQIYTQMLGKITSYEEQLRALQKENMQLNLNINACIDKGDDEVAKVYLKKQQDAEDKIAVLKDTLKELRSNATAQKEMLDSALQAVNDLKSENPFGEFSILKVPHFTKKKKKKCVNGTWQETDELENILDEYEVIK